MSTGLRDRGTGSNQLRAISKVSCQGLAMILGVKFGGYQSPPHGRAPRSLFVNMLRGAFLLNELWRCPEMSDTFWCASAANRNRQAHGANRYCTIAQPPILNSRPQALQQAQLLNRS